MEELEDLSQGSLSPNGRMSGIPYSNIIQCRSWYHVMLLTMLGDLLVCSLVENPLW